MKKYLALLLALMMVFALAACGQQATEAAPAEEAVVEEAPVEEVAEEPAEAEVMSYAEYAAAAIDDAVVVETYVQDKQSWWNDQATLYCQDEDGALLVYNGAISEDDYNLLVPGQKVRVTGYKAEWSGEVEIADAVIQVLDGNYVAPVTDVTELLGTDELAAHQNEFVTFKGLTVEPSSIAGDESEYAFLYSWDGSGAEGTDSDLYFKASRDGEVYTFVIEYYLRNESTDVYEAVRNLSVGDVIDLEGFLYWYEGPQPHITSVSPAA